MKAQKWIEPKSLGLLKTSPVQIISRLSLAFNTSDLNISAKESPNQMDLLSKAYGTASDDDADDRGNVAGGIPEHSDPFSTPPKRSRPETSFANPIPMPVFRRPSFAAEAPIPGSYISKRQRAAISADPKPTEPNPTYVHPSPGSLHFSSFPNWLV